jgi:ketol-acid reductoisomerase
MIAMVKAEYRIGLWNDDTNWYYWRVGLLRITSWITIIANTVARKKLYERWIISDTAEYGCYLFDHACKPLLTDFMKTIETNVIGT